MAWNFSTQRGWMLHGISIMTERTVSVSPLRAAMANLGITSDLKNGVRIKNTGTDDPPIQRAPTATGKHPTGCTPAGGCPADTSRNAHPAYRGRPPSPALPQEPPSPPLSAYDDLDAQVPTPTRAPPGADPQESSACAIIKIRFDGTDPRFSRRGFAPGDYGHHESYHVGHPGYSFARWAFLQGVSVPAWRRVMARLDRQAPSIQRAMLQHLDVWTAQIGSDRVALDEHLSLLERDMDLPREKVWAAMMLVDAVTGIGDGCSGAVVSYGFDNAALNGL